MYQTIDKNGNFKYPHKWLDTSEGYTGSVK